MGARTAGARRRVALALTLVALSTLFVIGSTSPASGGGATVDPSVQQRLDATGKATVWVMFRDRADLSAAEGIRAWGPRGAYVVRRLQATADASQAGVRRYLRGGGVSFESYWITNAVKATVGAADVAALAARPEVARIRADGALSIPQPIAGEPQAVEWNILRIRANEVWNTFGVRGDGIVVANIDTGVAYQHAALVRQYRGNTGSGFSHDYNWWDPSHVCPNPVPCDNDDHGTHTMGTMVGEDATLTNQIGVAPGARWIAAKGCETSFCSDSALLSSGQFVLNPANLNGQNPRPDLRPHIVNNSWSGGSGDPFYRDTVRAWLAAGMAPIFSNGNLGPFCRSSGSPGDFRNTYSAGAFDINNQIASFSSRGPSAFGPVKPNIAAPGVNVRSSVRNGGYASFSGTSMAAPHVAGTVALVWSANPSLIGQTDTASILDDTAIDTAGTQCGGTTDDNNVWGEGRLDAFAAVDAALG